MLLLNSRRWLHDSVWELFMYLADEKKPEQMILSFMFMCTKSADRLLSSGKIFVIVIYVTTYYFDKF